MSRLVLKVAGWAAFWTVAIVLLTFVAPYLLGVAVFLILWAGLTA